jgi:hypothetical protein
MPMLPRALALGLAALLLLSGCSVKPIPVRPAAAVEAALAHPDVAAWQRAHSASSPSALRPDPVVTLAPEGLLVRFTAASGPSPRRLEVVVDRTSGEVLEVKAR